MIRFAPTIAVTSRAHIGHLFNYLAARDLAKKLDKKFIVRLDLNPPKICGIPEPLIREYTQLFPADDILIHVNCIMPDNAYRDAFELSNKDFISIKQFGKDKFEGNGNQLKLLVFCSVLWDRRLGITDIVRDYSMKKPFPPLQFSIEDLESEIYDFMEIPSPSYHYVPTVTYDGDKISGGFYGQCPSSCKVSKDTLEENTNLLNKLLQGKQPVEWIGSENEFLPVDSFVTRQEPVMHGKVKMYPDAQKGEL